MNLLRIEVLTEIDFEEVSVGHIHVYKVPQKGHYLWFSEKRLGYSSWVVEDVCHHVGDGNSSSYPLGYQNIVIYAAPTTK